MSDASPGVAVEYSGGETTGRDGGVVVIRPSQPQQRNGDLSTYARSSVAALLAIALAGVLVAAPILEPNGAVVASATTTSTIAQRYKQLYDTLLMDGFGPMEASRVASIMIHGEDPDLVGATYCQATDPGTT